MDLSEPMHVSPLLDGFILGEAISDHHGVRCCPAIREDTDERYIVKIISIPATQVQLDALLLTGACADRDHALVYFKDLADNVVGEADILKKLSQLEGFVPYLGHQILQMADGVGYQVYLVSPYKPSLAKRMINDPLTHLGAVNMGLDLCAALTACRRMGYLYIDLKPENIFLSDTQGYQLGDLGFLPLNSLKYASLPEKYRSSFTAPEISDALSSLNDTMDIYALGLVLYQVYNNGQLPFDGSAPDVELPSPMYADYEMAEIILKACDPNPAKRWQDPAQMGQALVDYMQRNSINDTPIIPAPVVIEEPAEEVTDGFISEEENAQELEKLLALIPDEVPPQQLSLDSVAVEQAEVADIIEENAEVLPEVTEVVADSEQLSFLEDGDDLHETGVTNEVAQMLAQADDLIAHELPEPVVAPGPIDVPIPAPILEEVVEEIIEEPVETAPVVPVEIIETPAEEIIEEEIEEQTPPQQPARKGVRRWIAAGIVLLLLIGAGIGGFIWYNNFYLQSIDALHINGGADRIEVTVISDVDDAVLSVTCTDTYGNSQRASVSNGVAVFTDLNPATQYRIRLEANGLHKLVGTTVGSFTTENQTQILNFSAQCGPEDGSVTLSFVVNGPDCDQWTVAYGISGQEQKTETFSGHRVTLYDLEVGNDYIIRLLPAQDMVLSGTYELVYTAQKILYAKDLTVTACNNSALTVQWQQPEGAFVQKWTVRCFNNAGFDQTVTTENTTITFTDLDHTAGYTIQVTAQGMQDFVSTSVCADPLNVGAFTVNDNLAGQLQVTWEYTGSAPEAGWIVRYRVNGGAFNEITSTEASAQILLVPNGSYEITVSPAADRDCFGGSFSYGPATPSTFEGQGVTAADLTLSMVLRPNKTKWSHKDLSAEDYRNTFTSGEIASILAYSNTTYGTGSQTIVTTYVIRDSQNRPVSAETESRPWKSMWYQRYCELDLPVMPTQPDTYYVDIYFNDQYVGTLNFTVTE